MLLPFHSRTQNHYHVCSNLLILTETFCKVSIHRKSVVVLTLYAVQFLAHLSRRLVGELIVYPWSGVRPSSTISNMNISATCGTITMKFYQKHHWDRGKAALGFGPDWIKTLVSMATDSSHRAIMEKTLLPLFLSCS